MARKMTEQEAMDAAEMLLKIYEKIEREFFEREQDTITTFAID